MIRPVLALVLLVTVMVSGPAIARVKGFGWRRITFDLVATGVVGGVGLALGLSVIAGVIVTSATGVVSSVAVWTSWAGATLIVVLTALGGLSLTERLWRPRPGRGRALAGALAGLVAGGLIGYVAIILGQQSDFEVVVLCLIPLAAVSSILAGFALALPSVKEG